MTKKHVLVVEDEEDILELVRYHLERDGFAVSGALSGEQGLKAIAQKLPDLVLLDLMLPGMDGLEVCRRARADARTASVPIVMLTAKGEETDVVAGLELGAADYITKPFSPRVLVARVRAVLRRLAPAAPDTGRAIKVHDISITPGRHEVLCAGKAVELTATEFGILHFLARRPGWVFARDQIVDGVKGTDYAVTDRSVDVQMVSLRRKLGKRGEYLETVRGIGYRFREKP